MTGQDGDNGAASVAEIIICELAKTIKNHDLVHIGVTTPLGYVAAALAKCTHAPDLRLYALNISGYIAEPFPLTLTCYEAMALRYGARVRITDMYTHLERSEGCNYEPVIPVQIDRNGNVNLSLIGERSKPRVRLPGVGGLDVMGVMREAKVPFYTTRHNRRTFVERVDFITVMGTGRDGQSRSQLVPGGGGGPGRLVSDLGVFDFEGDGGTMRLLSLHPSVTADQIVENTSFPVVDVDRGDIPVTDQPTAQQLTLIREALDPFAIREFDLLSAGDRRKAVLEQLDREAEFFLGAGSSANENRRTVRRALAATPC